MAEQVTKNRKENFTEEEYHRFSRRRYWTISEFLKLVFNDKSLKYPNKASEEFGYLNLIFDGIYEESFESFKWGDPHPKTLRPIDNPHYSLPTQERYLVTTQVSAKQAFSFAHNLHLALAMEIQKDNPLYLVFSADRAVKLPEDFLKMEEEIDPSSSYLETLKISPAWTIKDLIRIIFGERFKENENLDDENVANFITLIKADINSKKISPINFNQKVNELDIFYKSTDLIEFIWSEKVFNWLMKIKIDILEWVEDLFNDVKIEEEIGVKEGNAEKLSSSEKQHKEKKSFFPASDGTNWNQVKFLIIQTAQIRVKIKNKQELFCFDKWKSKIPRKSSYSLIMVIFSVGSYFNKDNFDGAEKNNFKQYLSLLRKDLKELFNIDSDPFKALGRGEYQTNFGIKWDLVTSLEENQINPEDNLPFGRAVENSTSPEEDQLDSLGDSPLDFSPPKNPYK